MHCRIIPCVLFTLAVALHAQPSGEVPRFTREMEDFVKNFKPGGQDFTGQAVIRSPEETWKRLKPAPGYAVELIASEPEVRQPIDIRFDARGRLWVVQYLQYPFPAGLTVTSYDQYIRAEFNRLPPPPPRHFRGADKITILEDKDGDGRFETVKTFVDGLNMATSVLPAPDGVWVLMSPYLLFYPDRNGDDIPDGDPEVHLSGFMLEDTHSLASNLHWGPDGWIYGATGSTTTLDIQGIKLLGQGIWRYHPGTRVFEVFAEGGGNTFSFEFDRYGRAFSGTNNGATRGVHYAQGATYVKGWTKHGPALNPFIFGFFEHMGHEGYSQRFPQTFILYEGGAMPKLDGQIVVGMALTNRVQASEVFRDGSTFRTVDRDALITTEEKSFRPVDIEQGPDGAIYVADWSDLRLSHLNPKDTWDKGTGRIFRIVPEGFRRPAVRDLRKLATPELLALLGDANRELREQARQLLALRPEPIGPELERRLAANDASSLEAFWILNLRGELNEPAFRRALAHPNPHVRRWAVRLLGDRNSVSAAALADLAALARTEPDAEVRSQLASSAKRLPAGQTVALLRPLLARDEDASDKHLPLLLWWALEAKADTGREEILELVRDPVTWKSRIFTAFLAERLGQRYTADQGPRKYYTLRQGVYSDWIIDRAPEYLQRNLEMAGRLLDAAPGDAQAKLLLAGMAKGLTGPRVDSVPRQLEDAIARLWRNRPHSSALVSFAARLGQSESMSEALGALKSGKLNDTELQSFMELAAATGTTEAIPLVAAALRTEKNDTKRAKRLTALGGFDDVAAADALLEAYPTLSPRLQNQAQRMLSEKPVWAAAMLQKMNQGVFNPGVLASSNVALIRSHKDPRLGSLLTSYQQKHSDDPAQQAAQKLFEAGKVAYNLTCAPCHQESGGGLVGLAPALVGSRWLQQGEDALVRIVLHGKENSNRGLVMPPWRQLEDNQIAATLTYVRREFGNQATIVSPEKVAAVRQATNDRQKAWSDAELDALVGGKAK
jgi:putative membrane-bound dehydrogenase-like protein